LLFLLPLGLLAAAVAGGGGGGGSDDDDSDVEPTEGNDIIDGTSGPNEIRGLGGDDLLFGREGGDDIRGGADSDVIVGESGNDNLDGQSGSDLLIGGQGDDTLNGGSENDILVSGPGNDQLFGGVGEDDLAGVSGRDSLFGGGNDDFLDGRDPFGPNDTEFLVGNLSNQLPGALEGLYGDAGAAQAERTVASLNLATTNRAADVLDGGDGDDILLGDRGDTMTGGLGTDFFEVTLEDGVQPVQITDFDPAAETMEIFVGTLDAQVLSFADAAGGLQVLVDGNLVAVLQNVLAGDLTPGSVVLTGNV
jgi:Ca2+-binding RTX toxin-like protein